jgi:hypothetical protein
MVRRAALPSGLLAVVYSLFFVVPTYAQLPQIPIGCSPPSGLLDLIDPSVPKVIVERVDFDGPIHLSDSVIRDAVAYLNDLDLSASHPGWIDQFTEIGLRGAWQDRGYFRAKVTAEAHSLGRDAGEERFLVTAHVAEGLQYHLGDLRFVDARPGDVRPFSDSKLRELFPLHEGEIFNVALVRKGLVELTKLYNSQGYADFVATPETQVDDNLQRISIVMHFDEGVQFRVRALDVVGVEPSLESRLRAIIRLDESYDPSSIDTFLRQNGLLRFPGEPLEATRNQAAGTVDLLFDFRPCPPINSR